MGLDFSGGMSVNYGSGIGSGGSSVSLTNSGMTGAAAGQNAAAFQFPSWLQPNSNQTTKELQDSYAAIPQAFNVDNQVNSLNDSIAGQTNQMERQSNQSGQEYANRALLSGGSALGAGAVQAQAMMPTLASNAQMHAQAEGIKSTASQSAITLASQVANQIGTLRNNYLSNLIGYQNDAQQNYNQQLTIKNQQQSDQLAAANSLMAHPGSSGVWTTDPNGMITGGQDNANASATITTQQQAARATLAAIAAGH